MATMRSGSDLVARLWAAIGVLLLAALAARAVWIILQPLLPPLLVLLCLLGMARLLIRRRSW